MKEDKAKEYELMVMDVFSQKIAKECYINNLEFFHRKRFKGIDNNLYEIDIAFEFNMAGCKVLGIIECKNYIRKVSKSVVAEFITKKSQLNANIGLIVSPYGFQKGAIKLARNKGIKLAQVCHYSYTPLVGDPTLQDNYYNNLVNYIQEQDKSYSMRDIETYLLAKLDIFTGNAYRAEEIIDLKFSKKKIYNSLTYSETGFKLITDDKPVLVGKEHLLLILYCESLLLAGKNLNS